MSHDEIDELFGEGDGAPSPRTGAVLGLLGGGLFLGIVGLACTSVPGGLMVLAAWMLVEKEMDRIDSGYLPGDARVVVGRLQLAAYVSVLVVILLFVAQAWLFCSGAYDVIWSEMLAWYLANVAGTP